MKGPDKWHDLKLDKPNHCGKNKQSPIDIKTSEVEEEEDSYRRLNEFIWNQIKNFMSPLPISSMHGFLGVGSIAASKA